MNPTLVYLDNNASTPCDPRVIEVVARVMRESAANASSTHRAGAAAAARIEAARAQVAALIGAQESEVLFTSGGTESDNLALRGVLAARPDRRHLVVSAIEHAAVRDTALRLEQEGVGLTVVGVDAQGRVRVDEIAAALRPETGLVSVMLANNETGVLQPVSEVARVCRARGVRLHTDAVQACGRVSVDVRELGVDYLSLSGHKLHGPLGVGALFVRRGAPLRGIQSGGPQERERRAGTLNTPGIAGLGEACAIATREMSAEQARLAVLRERLERGIAERFPAGCATPAHRIGAEAARLSNTSCVCFEGVAAEPLLLLLSEAAVCVSSGSACSSGSLEPSHVLRAQGIAPQVAQGQIRFSLGRGNCDADIDRVLALLAEMVPRVARLSG